MVIFHSYVSLPEGNWVTGVFPVKYGHVVYGIPHFQTEPCEGIVQFWVGWIQKLRRSWDTSLQWKSADQVSWKLHAGGK